jgi:2,3-dihydroxyphenylpropionate 1,2-dioxygenase
MGEIVWAAATVHAPQLLTRPPQEDQAQLETSISAMAELGKGLDETNPDVLIIVGLDHVEAFFPGVVPAFAIVTGPRAKAGFAALTWDLPIHQNLAGALAEGLIDDGIDIAYTDEAPLGHAFMAPLEFIHAGRAIPVIPLFVNVYMPPLPSPRRAFEVGQAIGRVLAERPERVAILASGGMSHYPGTHKYFDPAYDFDRWVIQELEEGRVESMLNLSSVQLDETGNTELLTWMVALGASGVDRGELLTYQATSHHGHGVMRFIPAKGERGQIHRDMANYGGFKFRDEGYQFYRHPTPEEYPLNRGLAELKRSPELRARYVLNIDGVCEELGLSADNIGAMKTYSTAALVAQGAHGILALSTLLALQVSARDAGIVVATVA